MRANGHQFKLSEKIHNIQNNRSITQNIFKLSFRDSAAAGVSTCENKVYATIMSRPPLSLVTFESFGYHQPQATS